MAIANKNLVRLQRVVMGELRTPTVRTYVSSSYWGNKPPSDLRLIPDAPTEGDSITIRATDLTGAFQYVFLTNEKDELLFWINTNRVVMPGEQMTFDLRAYFGVD